MTIKINRATWVAGEPVKVGEVLNIDDDNGKLLIQLGHAELTKAAAQQPQKPVFTRGQ